MNRVAYLCCLFLVALGVGRITGQQVQGVPQEHVPPLQALVEQVADQVGGVAQARTQPPVISISSMRVDRFLTQAWAGRLHKMLASRLSRDLRLVFQDSLVDTGGGQVEWVGRPSERPVDLSLHLKLSCRDNRLVMGVTVWSVPEDTLLTLFTVSIPFPGEGMDLGLYSFPQESPQGWQRLLSVTLPKPVLGLATVAGQDETLWLATDNGLEAYHAGTTGLSRRQEQAWPGVDSVFPSYQPRVMLRPAGENCWQVWNSSWKGAVFFRPPANGSDQWRGCLPPEGTTPTGWQIEPGTDLWRFGGNGPLSGALWRDWLLLPETLGRVWVLVDDQWHLLLMDLDGQVIWRSEEAGGDRLALSGGVLAWTGQGLDGRDVLTLYRLDGGRLQLSSRISQDGLINEVEGGQWNRRPGFWGVVTDRDMKSWQLVFWGQS